MKELAKMPEEQNKLTPELPCKKIEDQIRSTPGFTPRRLCPHGSCPPCLYGRAPEEGTDRYNKMLAAGFTTVLIRSYWVVARRSVFDDPDLEQIRSDCERGALGPGNISFHTCAACRGIVLANRILTSSVVREIRKGVSNERRREIWKEIEETLGRDFGAEIRSMFFSDAMLAATRQMRSAEAPLINSGNNSRRGSETARKKQQVEKRVVVAKIQTIFDEVRKNHPDWPDRALIGRGLVECHRRGIEKSDRQIRRYIKQGELTIS